MIGSVSHGIKGLLTGLDGGLYILESGVSRDDRGQSREGLAIVKQTVERIRKMVLDVLFYAKERSLNWQKVDLASFAEEVAQVVAAKTDRRGIVFVRDFAPNAGEAEMDPECIHSALINILENAIDACEKDDAAKPHKIVFRVRRQPDQVCFEVQDNGIGMDADTREKIFTLFFSSKGSKGTGFGLFIANHVVKQHGGAISVKSAPGQGALFTVKIPVPLPENVKG
jgi:signal transduction histidine kinase